MNWLRVFFRGGLTSYRALFHWLNPWIYVPMLIITPLFEMFFFAYFGRAAGVESDTHFVVGNALIASAVAGLWGMSHTINGERRSQTLAALLSSPASRTALFLGRSLPTMANGVVVALLCLLVGAVTLDFDFPASTAPALVVAIFVASLGCAALGLCVGALGLRGRNVTVLDNMVLVLLLLVSGANVPLDRLPGWLEAIGRGVPLTHGIEAVRELVAGATLAEVGDLLATEAGIAAAYGAAGLLLLRVFELQSRRTASLEVF